MKETEKIIKFKIKNFTVYKISIEQCVRIFNGLGICDSCNDFATEGYYIPILNSYYCEECYNDFIKTSIYYYEDEFFELWHIKEVERICKKLKIIIEEKEQP